MNMALADDRGEDDDETIEDHDQPHHGSAQDADQRQLLRVHRDAEEQDPGSLRRAVQDSGKVKHRPFHSYTMKQAIQEGFILDVLKNYTPVDSYYRLVRPPKTTRNST